MWHYFFKKKENLQLSSGSRRGEGQVGESGGAVPVPITWSPKSRTSTRSRWAVSMRLKFMARGRQRKTRGTQSGMRRKLENL